MSYIMHVNYSTGENILFLDRVDTDEINSEEVTKELLKTRPNARNVLMMARHLKGGKEELICSWCCRIRRVGGPYDMSTRYIGGVYHDMDRLHDIDGHNCKYSREYNLNVCSECLKVVKDKL